MTNKQLTAICLGYEVSQDTACAGVLEQLYYDFKGDMLTTEQLAEHANLDHNLVEHALSLGAESSQGAIAL